MNIVEFLYLIVRVNSGMLPVAKPEHLVPVNVIRLS